MPGHRLRRWSSTDSTPGKRLVLNGMFCCTMYAAHTKLNPANTRRRPNVESLLDQRPQRWPTTKNRTVTEKNVIFLSDGQPSDSLILSRLVCENYFILYIYLIFWVQYIIFTKSCHCVSFFKCSYLKSKKIFF